MRLDLHFVERALAALTVACVGAWSLYVLAFGSDADLSVPVVLVMSWGGMAVLSLWSLRLGLHLIATRSAPERRRIRRLLAQPALLLFCFVFVWTGAAFRIRFLVSRPALDRFVRERARVIQSAELAPRPRVGLFWLREVEVLPGGIVRVITTECMFDDCGMAYSPNGEPPRIGEDSYRPLGGGWWHWWRSW